MASYCSSSSSSLYFIYILNLNLLTEVLRWQLTHFCCWTRIKIDLSFNLQFHNFVHKFNYLQIFTLSLPFTFYEIFAYYDNFIMTISRVNLEIYYTLQQHESRTGMLALFSPFSSQMCSAQIFDSLYLVFCIARFLKIYFRKIYFIISAFLPFLSLIYTFWVSL